MKGSRLILWWVAMAMVMAAGCAKDVGTIDRTQHDKLEKSLFAGLWYYNSTVIDVPADVGFTTVGEMSSMVTGWEINKVIFDIQEKLLVVYPTVEYVEGSEKQWRQEKIFKYWDDACLSKESEKFQCVDGVDNLDQPSKTCCFVKLYVGQPLAAFEITSHFDVTRKYNAQTGEQTNVLEENTLDRKWWQRRYVRVNWAKNLVQDYTFMAGIVKQTPIDYYVQGIDPDNPDAPTLGKDYIDVVLKAFAEPNPDVCNTYAVSTGDCTSAVVKFRTAFRKVDPSNDYETRTFTNTEHMELFGFFLKSRYAYDPVYGVTNEGKISYPFRWNLWDKTMEESPVTDAEGKEVKKPCFKDPANTGCDTTNRDGSREFCKADDWFQFGQCVVRTPKPYVERGLRPLVWHVSAAYPDDMWPAAVRTAEVWSKAYKDTVAWLYLYEQRGLIYGQTHTRACNTDADCTPPDAVIDTKFAIDDPNPKDSADAKVQKRKPIKTLVITGAGKNGAFLWDWDYPADLSAKAGVRFLDLSGKTAELTAGTAKVKAGKLLDKPANHYDSEIVTMDPGKVDVSAGGQTLKGFDLKAGGFTLFVLTKDSKLIATWSKRDWAEARIRVVNAGTEAVDVSIDGGLRVRDLAPGMSAGYLEVGGGIKGTNVPAVYVLQRIVAVKAGSRGDLTCARIENFNRCVGYGARITGDDWKKLDEIRAKLPEMFVICRNKYDAAYDDKYKTDRYAPWVDVQAGKADLQVVNPCIDGMPYVTQPGDTKSDIAAERKARADSMKKNGDIRYSMIHWIPEALAAAPLGLGPTGCDPDTGESFWGVANIYGAPIRTYAAMTRDLFDLINGKLNADDYVTGKKIREYVLGSQTSSLESGLTSTEPVSLPEEMTEVKPQALEVDQAAINQVLGKKFTSYDILKILRDKQIGEQMMKGLPVIGTSLGKQRLAAIKGTPYEDMLINDEVKLAASGGKLQPGDQYTDADKAGLSPINWATLEDVYQKERARQVYLAKHNWCYADFNDEGVIGMAKSWGCIPGDKRQHCGKDFDALDPKHDAGSTCCIDDGKQLEDAILLRFSTAIIEHEVGHTMGLRHNFEGSSDLFNFQDKYFDVREREAVPCKIDQECEMQTGQVCNEGFCESSKAAQCSNSSECGFVMQKCSKLSDCDVGTACAGGRCIWNTGAYDCVQGKCKELRSCGLHQDCGADGYCDGDNQWCLEKATGKRFEKDIENAADPKVKVMIPRGPLTKSEIEKSRVLYQYSSIMDYGQRWNSDALDLGKYDYAAIRFGYGGLLDVYTNTDHLWQFTKQQAQYYGDSETNQSDSLDSSYWSWGVSFSQFYFLQNMIGVTANLSEGEHAKNRAAVPWDWVRDEHGVMMNYYRRQADWSYVIVPYKFCGDEYRGNVGCYTWDTGLDILEIVHNMGIELQEYYLIDAFKRERYGFGRYGDPNTYLARITSRWMDPMKGAGMYYALFNHILKNYGAFRGVWANGRMMGWALRRASETGFEILANSMGSPAPGSYKLDAATGTYRNYSYQPGLKGADLSIPLGIGKYPYTTFMNGAGYFYWEHALWIGSFWEKLGALMTLTDSTVYFTTNYVGEQLNIGVGTSIGFNSLYPQQITELFGAVVNDDAGRYAHLVDGNKAVGQRQWFDPDNSEMYTSIASGYPASYFTPKSYGTDVKSVEPSIENLTMKLYFMLYGMAYIPASFDPTFLDSFSVCIKGNGNCFAINASTGVETKEFENPFGGKTYVVWKPTYTKTWYSPNFELVEKANTLKVAWESVSGEQKAKAEMELRQTIEALDLMTGIYAIYSNIKI